MSGRRARGWAAAVAFAITGACGRGAPAPAVLDTRNDACQTCRMAVSDVRYAAQLVAPGEEPKFFDDIGCLATYVREHACAVERATAYVADHRTRAWVPAVHAVFARVPRVETPMYSHLIAHADVASRAADGDAVGGTAMTAMQVFGPKGPPAAGLHHEASR
jgi:copper chaperone NosL